MNKAITIALALILLLGVGYVFLSKAPQVDTVPEIQEESILKEKDSEPLSQGDYLGDYTVTDEERGTITTVSVSGDTRTIKTNALPNHETGKFPNAGNPNTIAAQDNSYEFPAIPVFTGDAIFARTPGVAINGVKFEPQTAERVICSTNTYSVEAIQDVVNLGLDFNNAHVQPTGAYHYHGVSDLLTEAYDSGDDLVHVGFAADGYLMYYSKSGAYTPSYTLTNKERSETQCTLTVGGPSAPTGNTPNTVDLVDFPQGSFVSDWEYQEGLGDLDECNGITINGTYAYLITDDYPYIGRCLNGESNEEVSGPRDLGSQRPPTNSERPPRRNGIQ